MYLFSNIRGPPRCSWGTPSRFQGVLQFQEVVVLPNAEPVSHHICPCAWDERSMGEMPMQKAVRGAAPHPAVPASAVDVDVDVAVTGCFAPSGFRKPLVTACRNRGAWSSRRKGECGPWEKNLFSGRNPSAAPWSPRSEPKQRNEDPSAKVFPES